MKYATHMIEQKNIYLALEPYRNYKNSFRVLKDSFQICS